MTVPAGCAGSGDDGGADDGTARLLEGWGCSSSPDATRLRDRDGDNDAVAASAGSPGGVATPCRDEEVGGNGNARRRNIRGKTMWRGNALCRSRGGNGMCRGTGSRGRGLESLHPEWCLWVSALLDYSISSSNNSRTSRDSNGHGNGVHNHKNNTNNNIW